MRGWISVLGLTAACASVAGVLNSPLDLGRAHTFHTTPDQALAATRAAFGRLEFRLDTLTYPDSVTWLVVGSHAGGFAEGSGELVRVVGRRLTDSTTEVRVLTKRYNPTDLWGTGDWSPTLFTYLTAFLSDSRAGTKPLSPPSDPP